METKKPKECKLTPWSRHFKGLQKRETFLESWLQLQGLLDGRVFACSLKEEREVKLMVVKLLPSCSSLYLKPMECNKLSLNENHNYNGGQLWSLAKVQVS